MQQGAEKAEAVRALTLTLNAIARNSLRRKPSGLTIKSEEAQPQGSASWSLVFRRSHWLVAVEATSPGSRRSPRSRSIRRSIRSIPGVAKGRLRARGDLRPHIFSPPWEAVWRADPALAAAQAQARFSAAM